MTSGVELIISATKNLTQIIIPEIYSVITKTQTDV